MSAVAALYVCPRGPYPGLSQRRCELNRQCPGGAVLIDCWDESRDARLYDGPHPVIAHPPCKHWSGLRHLAHVGCADCEWRGPRSKLVLGSADTTDVRCPECGCSDLESDADCAPRAVEQVRKWGGVLEHPAGSLLWEHDLCPQERDTCGCNRLPEPWICACGWREPWLSTDGFCPYCYALVAHARDAHGGYTIEVPQVEWGHVARKRTWLYLVGVPREALEAPPFPGREPTHYASGGRTKSSRNGGAVPPGMKVCSAQQRRRTPQLFAEYLIRLARAVRK